MDSIGFRETTEPSVGGMDGDALALRKQIAVVAAAVA